MIGIFRFNKIDERSRKKGNIRIGEREREEDTQIEIYISRIANSTATKYYYSSCKEREGGFFNGEDKAMKN